MPFGRRRIDSERLYCLCKVTQLVNGGTRIISPVSGAKAMLFPHLHSFYILSSLLFSDSLLGTFPVHLSLSLSQGKDQEPLAL